MSDLLPFVVIGITFGSVYAIAGMGLVLTYKTSGVFNFAHGSIAAIAGYAFYEMRQLHGLPWPLAAIVCVLVVGPLLGVVFERLARTLGEQPLTMRIVATVGLLGAITGFVTVRYGSALIQVSPYLPTRNVRLVGVNFGVDQLITSAVAVVLAIGLYVFFRVSRLGLAMRAVVEDPSLVAIGGISPARVRRWAWILGSTFAALSGVLLAPIYGLEANVLTLVVVYSFGAAAIGAFSSLPLTYLGGIGIGIAARLSTKYIGDVEWLAGLPASLPFIVLFVALLVLPKRTLVDASQAQARVAVARASTIPIGVRRAGLALLGIALVVIPHVVGAKLPVYTNALIFVILYLSFRLLVRTSGQVSLCHATFAAVGASTFAHLAGDLPWLVALGLAGLVVVPVGAIVAIPAIRLSGLYLAIGTFGFGILAEQLIFPRAFMFGRLGTLQAPRPALPLVDRTTDIGFYYVVLAVVLAAALLTAAIHRGRLGRLLAVLAQSPTALITNGASANTARVLVFCLSAFTAGIAGALFASQFQSISGAGFNSFQSLQWLTILVLAGTSRYGAAFLAAFLTAVLPSYGTSDQAAYAPVLYGIAVVAYASLAGRTDLLARLARAPRARARRLAAGPVSSRQVEGLAT